MNNDNDTMRRLLARQQSPEMRLHQATRPRQYAAEICRERDIEKRRELLALVPDEYRPLVETHVRNAFMLKAARK